MVTLCTALARGLTLPTQVRKERLRKEKRVTKARVASSMAQFNEHLSLYSHLAAKVAVQGVLIIFL